MKSNDWRHKNVARYTPGNTKILYFFNCLLDGMHTTSIAIWDIDPATLPEKEMEETNWELLSDEEMEALFINNQTN